MPSDLTLQAVTAALNNNWQDAIRLNLTILKENSQNVEALNRLARAYKESGDLKLAQKTYRKVLTLDRYNPIAQKNFKLLERLPKNFKKKLTKSFITNPSVNSFHVQPQMFLEEPGKTKVISLVNLAPTSSLLPLCCGDQITLLIKRRTVIATSGDTYIGALPDDLSIKLIKRISGGNRYEAFIKTVGSNSLSVLVREVYRATRFKNQPTFPGASGEFYSYGKNNSLTPDEDLETNLTDDRSLLEEDLTTA